MGELLPAPSDRAVSEEVWAATRDVLTLGREAVQDLWNSRNAQGHEPDEEELTNELCLKTFGHQIRYVQFNRQQESKTGSDWVWWFVDEPDGFGPSFGMLVQAKKFKPVRDKWQVDLAYPNGTCRQLYSLMDSSSTLGVPASYILYRSTSETGLRILPCSEHSDAPTPCRGCLRSGVTAIPSLAAESILGTTSEVASERAEATARAAIPLEDIVLPTNRPVLLPALIGQISRDSTLANFLISPQSGARAVAKRMLEVLALQRVGQFRAIRPGEPIHEIDEYDESFHRMPGRPVTGPHEILGEIPQDPGHFSQPYVQHILQGLRSEAPDYVKDALQTGTIRRAPGGITGVAIVHLG